MKVDWLSDKVMKRDSCFYAILVMEFEIRVVHSFKGNLCALSIAFIRSDVIIKYI